MSLLLARNGHADRIAQCPLSGAKQKTYTRIELFSFCPTRTLAASGLGHTAGDCPPLIYPSFRVQFLYVIVTVEAKMTGLEFTSEAAKQLERVYLTRDMIAQRLETVRQLNLSSGESVLDVGCGPGYLCESMGEIVGRHGAVVGIDISTDLIALCNRRKASEWLSYAIGDATKLNQADASFDVVVCTQVAEYVPDV
jgi:SAM-dependent methyltransferase